jgi:hypothetical protein
MTDFDDFYRSICNAEGRIGALVLIVRSPTRTRYIEPPVGLSPRQMHMLISAAIEVARAAPRLRCVGCGTNLLKPPNTLVLCAAAPGLPKQWMNALSCWSCDRCAADANLPIRVNQFIEAAGRKRSIGAASPNQNLTTR